jgi:hypothetical protein
VCAALGVPTTLNTIARRVATSMVVSCAPLPTPLRLPMQKLSIAVGRHRLTGAGLWR